MGTNNCLTLRVNVIPHLGLIPEGHDSRHLLLGDLNLPPAIAGLFYPPDAEVAEPLRVLLRLLAG